MDTFKTLSALSALFFLLLLILGVEYVYVPEGQTSGVYRLSQSEPDYFKKFITDDHSYIDKRAQDNADASSLIDEMKSATSRGWVPIALQERFDEMIEHHYRAKGYHKVNGTIYYDSSVGTQVRVGADAESFEIGQTLTKGDYPYQLYARDAVKVYLTGEEIVGADPKTFQIFNNGLETSPDANIARDATHIYKGSTRLLSADPQSFVEINKDSETLDKYWVGVFLDKNAFYRGPFRISKFADGSPITFETSEQIKPLPPDALFGGRVWAGGSTPLIIGSKGYYEGTYFSVGMKVFTVYRECVLGDRGFFNDKCELKVARVGAIGEVPNLN